MIATRINFTLLFLIILVLLFWVNGCAGIKKMPEKEPEQKIESQIQTNAPPQKTKSPPPWKPEYFRHKVRWNGETLSHIALWYTGSTKNWKKIAAANPSIAADDIRVGNVILIPKDLLKTQEKMPSKFVPALSSPRSKPTQIAVEAPPPTKSNDIDLFEPVDSVVNETTQPSRSTIEDIELFEPVGEN